MNKQELLKFVEEIYVRDDVRRVLLKSINKLDSPIEEALKHIQEEINGYAGCASDPYEDGVVRGLKFAENVLKTIVL